MPIAICFYHFWQKIVPFFVLLAYAHINVLWPSTCIQGRISSTSNPVYVSSSIIYGSCPQIVTTSNRASKKILPHNISRKQYTHNLSVVLITCLAPCTYMYMYWAHTSKYVQCIAQYTLHLLMICATTMFTCTVVS